MTKQQRSSRKYMQSRNRHRTKQSPGIMWLINPETGKEVQRLNRALRRMKRAQK